MCKTPYPIPSNALAPYVLKISCYGDLVSFFLFSGVYCDLELIVTIFFQKAGNF